MSDEEKKAIEWLKKADWFSARLYSPTILNLIEKQSKEIEELKEKNKNLNWYFENQKDNFVHKDKIKAKIEEYEKALNILLQKDEWIEPSDTIIRNKFMHYIEFGQSLLEKE